MCAWTLTGYEPKYNLTSISASSQGTPWLAYEDTESQRPGIENEPKAVQVHKKISY